MNSKAEIGLEGEQQAIKYLMSKGYEILKTNYRYRRSEIDIIARNTELLVFIEVKTKSYSAFGEPEIAVDEKKANKVMEGADQFIEVNNWHGDIRFDVISIIINRGRYEIRHFEDAFH